MSTPSEIIINATTEMINCSYCHRDRPSKLFEPNDREKLKNSNKKIYKCCDTCREIMRGKYVSNKKTYTMIKCECCNIDCKNSYYQRHLLSKFHLINQKKVSEKSSEKNDYKYI